MITGLLTLVFSPIAFVLFGAKILVEEYDRKKKRFKDNGRKPGLAKS